MKLYVPQQFRVRQMRASSSCAQNIAATVCHWCICIGFLEQHILAEDSGGASLLLGGSGAPPQQGLETSHLWLPPASTPSRRWAGSWFPGSRETGNRSSVSQDCRTALSCGRLVPTPPQVGINLPAAFNHASWFGPRVQAVLHFFCEQLIFLTNH